MINRPAPKIHIVHNPWSQTVPDGVLLQRLMTASADSERQIRTWISHALDTPGAPRDACAPPDAVFAQVYLDPTRRRRGILQDSVMAYVLFGDPDQTTVMTLLTNALAKADAVLRHGQPSGVLVETASFLLDDDDFAWGGGQEYRGAIGGGSGLTEWQDGYLVHESLKRVMDSIHRERRRLIKEARLMGKRGWYNTQNQPGELYVTLASQLRQRESITQAF